MNFEPKRFLRGGGPAVLKLILYLRLFADSDAVPVPAPDFHPRPSGSRKRAPARCIFLKGSSTGNGKISPLRKMTSAAYGVGHHSIADVTAVGARCRPSSHRRLGWEFYLVKRGRTRHAPIGHLVRR